MIAEIIITSKNSIKIQLLGMLLLVLCIFFILGSVIVKGENSEQVTPENKYFTNITIEKGDTVWDIAKENIDRGHYDSINEYIYEIRQLNELKSDTIYEGEQLTIAYYATSPRH